MKPRILFGIFVLLIFFGAGCTRLARYPVVPQQEEQTLPLGGGATPRALAPFPSIIQQRKR